MSHEKDSLKALVDRMICKAPELLDIISAETEDEFDLAFNPLLEKAINHLEKNKKNFKNLSEDGLTAVLAIAVSAPGLTVTQETNSNGHVDLTIVANHSSPARIKLGEAKIYDGFNYHVSGLQQLLGRYTTGRESSGLLIAYFRKKNISGLIKKLREQMDEALPLDQVEESSDHILKWSFFTLHNHNSSGEDLKIGHIGCNLHLEEKT